MPKLYVIEVTIACPIGQVTMQVVQAGSCEVVQVQAVRDVDGVLDYE